MRGRIFMTNPHPQSTLSRAIHTALKPIRHAPDVHTSVTTSNESEVTMKVVRGAGSWKARSGASAILPASMPTFIALLRGVNVGGHKKLRMSELKTICEAIGLQDVQTYLQSGNVVFRSRRAATGTLGRNLETVLQERAGVESRIVLRTADDLRQVVAGNPFGSDRDPSRLMVAFLDGELSNEAKAALQKAALAEEELHFAEREVYLYFPEGAGNSKLMNVLTEKKLGVTATTRNWNTVTALLRLAEATGP